MAQSGFHHRATLKQSNKGFKSKHSSKGALKAAAKGKIVAPTSAAGGKSSKNVQASSKKARLNANSQKRDLKRKEVVHDVKFFSTSSGGGQVPRIITVVPLVPIISLKRFLAGLVPNLGLTDAELEEVSAHLDNNGTYLVRAPRYKTNLQINLLPTLSVYAALDAALVSDYLVLVMSSTHEVQLEGEAVLRCLQAQVGGVEVVPVVQAPENDPLHPSSRSGIHRSLLSFTRYFFPKADKVYSADTPSEATILARAICEGAPRTTRADDGRAYVVAEGSGSSSGGISWTATGMAPKRAGGESNGDSASGEEEMKEVGRLEITGTVRGGCLSADRLVHIPGRGDFQIESVVPAPPSALQVPGKPHRHANSMALDGASEPLSVPSEGADDLTAHNVPDLLANEQTWPTEEEMDEAPALVESERVRTKRVPKGTSAYQAAWIVDDEDDDEDEDDDDDDEEHGDMNMEGEEGDVLDGDGEGGDYDEDEEETEEIELDSRKEDSGRHKDLDPEQEQREYEAYLKEREKAAEEDQRFPDEIDTPRHIAARTRFQRYRGLKSFRTSPWDPYENLPLEYGRIFQFEDFARTGKRLLKDAKEAGVKPGMRVTIVLKDVPKSVVEDRDAGLPFILHGLLQHEHKQSVLHFLVQRNTEYEEPVKAKDPMIMCVGPRRYVIKPLYSQHVRGGGKGVNNVHKSEKFLRPGSATVATTFGPVCFGKQACIMLKDEGEGKVPSLVAMGSSLPPDPTRIIAKRIILTGHPLKIHKKTATIRYMFFERDDVDYFKTVELRTKYGRTGHITEALGTHGYFKAHFDGPIGQMDTICMSLYKRQFPKWSEEFRPTRAMLEAPEEVQQAQNGMEVE